MEKYIGVYCERVAGEVENCEGLEVRERAKGVGEIGEKITLAEV